MMRAPTVFITGAATGIGAGLAKNLADNGWQVFAGYRQSSPNSAPWYGHASITPVKCDIACIDDVARAAAMVSGKTGNALDLLINNAGYFNSGGVVEAADMDAYRKAMEINLYGVLNVIKAFMPMVRQGSYPRGGKGRIINVASSSTFMIFPMAAAYTVSKQALKTASAHLRMEMAPFEVQVTTLDPGVVDTPMSSDDHKGAAQWQAIPEHLRPLYRQHFIDSDTLMNNNHRVSATTPEHFANEVYRKIVVQKRFKPLYAIGPGVAAMPLMHRLLSLQQLEKIWTRLFRLRPDHFSTRTRHAP